ncbi:MULTISPECIES: amino acid ABC transporter permease [Roseobacteraceae]|uniref:Glutamate/aspartate import permease protein GltK n=1 Tax=Pseudosulfitobacter pseudonitzschiae TaxID=1402135 RepID=A0A221K6M8_9RHOB|nr:MULTISPECIES: amino acid ABC transporter permease [Roseobacteraceae]ASM74530.1 putative glutamine ABC transporter permease protein GlnM [Pseudosulfitobacter pseudonitzschiae]
MGTHDVNNDVQVRSASDTVTSLKIVPQKQYGLWGGTALVLVLMYFIIRAFAVNPAFEWDVARSYMFHPSIMHGLYNTLLLTVIIMITATILGTIIAIMRVSRSEILNGFAGAYVWFFRGVPALIQLIFWFNLSLLVSNISVNLPFVGEVFSVRTNDFMTPFFSAIVALALCEAGYMAEIIRAGIKSVPSGQAEAATALGMPYRMILKRITLPQAMRFVVPPTGNEAINLLKMTSLVTFIAVDDLFYSAQSIYARTFETIPLLIVVSTWYLAVVSIMSVGQYFLERYFGRSDKPNETLFDTWIRAIFGRKNRSDADV